MGSQCSYTLSITGPGAGFVSDKVIARLRSEYREAEIFLDEVGGSSGNEGPWRSIEDDMLAFSRDHPIFLFRIEEDVDYETTQYALFWFKAGKMVRQEPIMVWPDFDESLLK